uniref:Uncharacterized protein n=1 Tax=Arundo donax TaxID=35708 RepID=A0A0A8ZKL5_ARUDO
MEHEIIFTALHIHLRWLRSLAKTGLQKAK